MLINSRAMTNNERQAKFRALHPGYNSRYRNRGQGPAAHLAAKATAIAAHNAWLAALEQNQPPASTPTPAQRDCSSE